MESNAPLAASLFSRAAEQLAQPVLALVNHLIRAEPAAQAELAPHANKSFALRLNQLDLPDLQVTAAGFLALAPNSAAPPHLRVEVDSAEALRLLAQGKSPSAAASISGEAGFAQSVAWLFANLRWEAGADLARFIGPAAAQTVQEAFARFARDTQQSAAGLSGMVQRGLGDARSPLLTQSGAAGLRAELRELRDDVARLEQRLALLEAKRAP